MKSIDAGGIITGLADGFNDILGLRDSLGVALMPVYFVERKWTGEEIGDGQAYETKTQILPSPKIVQMTDDSRVQAGGAIQLDDIQLRGISKVTYRNKSDVDGTSAVSTTERFYEVDGFLYVVANVREKHLTWDVLIRKQSNARRYPEPPPPPEPPDEGG